MPSKETIELERDISSALNRNNIDRKLNMPDFVLAKMIVKQLYAMQDAIANTNSPHAPTELPIGDGR